MKSKGFGFVDDATKIFPKKLPNRSTTPLTSTMTSDKLPTTASSQMKSTSPHVHVNLSESQLYGILDGHTQPHLPHRPERDDWITETQQVHCHTVTRSSRRESPARRPQTARDHHAHHAALPGQLSGVTSLFQTLDGLALKDGGTV